MYQYEEPSELVYLLGGELAIRQVISISCPLVAIINRTVQGIRAHWTSENTAMHSVRSHNGCIFIEEHDLVNFAVGRCAHS